MANPRQGRRLFIAQGFRLLRSILAKVLLEASQQHLDILGFPFALACFYNTHVSRNALMRDEIREILHNFISLQFGINTATQNFYSS